MQNVISKKKYVDQMSGISMMTKAKITYQESVK